MSNEDEGSAFDTRAVHAGHDPDGETGSRAPPIYQTTSYVCCSVGGITGETM